MTKSEKIKRAVQVLKAPKGTVQQKISYLQGKGLTMNEILEAANALTGVLQSV